MDWELLGKTLVSLLVIVDPLGLIPFYLAMVQGRSDHDQRRIAVLTPIAVVITLIVATFVGGAILGLFGITLSAFRIAGGVLILIVALDMLHARKSRSKTTPEEAEEAISWQEIAVVPLAIPLSAGPGAISTSMIYSVQFPTLAGKLAMCGAIVVVGIATWLCLRLAEPISRRIGQIGINIGMRLMGLLLAALGVEYILVGLLDTFPALAAP